MGMYVTQPQAPEKRIFERVHTRKLDRSVAHARMKKAGLEKVNKHDYAVYKSITGMLVHNRIDSYFSSHWREVADKELNNM